MVADGMGGVDAGGRSTRAGRTLERGGRGCSTAMRADSTIGLARLVRDPAKGACWPRGPMSNLLREEVALRNLNPSLLELRLKGLKLFGRNPMPNWGLVLTRIAFQIIPTVRGGAAL